MVDVDRRMTGLNPSHISGLRRLSTRASRTPLSSATPRTGLLSFTSLAHKLITHLKNHNIRVEHGLTEPEFALAEAEFKFTFPPDLKAVLSLGLPVGPGFPNWRSVGSIRTQLKAQLDIPLVSVSFHVARNALWSRSWGKKPHDLERAVKMARHAIKRVPLLIPVFGHCYLPCNPTLAGNPVFFVDENQIFCCGSDLLDFFDKKLVIEKSIKSSCGSPRWVEFWSDAVVDVRRRNSSSCSSSSSSSDHYFDLARSPELPIWVREYLSEIKSVLREGGWGKSDVEEIVHVSASGFFEGDMIFLDNQAVLDALLLKVDRFSDLLMKSGWSPEEVSDCLGFEFRPEKETRRVKKLSSELVTRFEKLAQSVSKS